jgi:hypothetical protein
MPDIHGGKKNQIRKKQLRINRGTLSDSGGELVVGWPIIWEATYPSGSVDVVPGRAMKGRAKNE